MPARLATSESVSDEVVLYVVQLASALACRFPRGQIRLEPLDLRRWQQQVRAAAGTEYHRPVESGIQRTEVLYLHLRQLRRRIDVDIARYAPR